MPIDFQFSGTPQNIVQPSDGLGIGADTYNGSLWLVSQGGTFPASFSQVAKAVYLTQTANIATVLTYTSPVNAMYFIDAYEVSTVATSGTLPSVTATYTDADYGSSVTQTIMNTASTSAAGTANSASGTINAKAGTTITIATTSYATTTYNLRVRVVFIGAN